MKKLKFGDLINMYNSMLLNRSREEVSEIPVYIGDDEELNGIHCAFYGEHCDRYIESDFVNINKQDETNVVPQGEFILIS